MTAGTGLGSALAAVFVGRVRELHHFRRWVRGEGERARPILNVHGPGGVGKSTLLDAWGAMAEEAGVRWIPVDLAAGSPSASRLATIMAGEAGSPQPFVLALDSYEEVGSLDRWVREVVLAGLPPWGRVVIAGRVPLRTLWRHTGGWRELVEELPLEGFSRAETARYLALHGLGGRDGTVRLAEAAWQATQGNPLALSLAAAVARREGPAAVVRTTDHPEVVAELTRRYLREVPDERLRRLLEAAVVTRRFDQESLAETAGEPVGAAEFERLTSLSFVRGTAAGWAMHALVRRVLRAELRWRAPARLEEMRGRAVAGRLRILTGGASHERWSAALADFFYLLEDTLLQAVFFGREEGDDGVFVRPATEADLPELLAYFEECRERARAAGPAAFEVTDPRTGRRFAYSMPWVDFLRAPLDIPGYLALGPGVVRLARDHRDVLRGISVVIPIHAGTLPYLEGQPVTGPYFRGLSPEEREGYAVPPGEATAWYIRHINTRDLTDAPARGALFRDLFQVAFRNGRLLTSSPVPFFQDILRRCGFVEVPGATHYDFGADFPSPTYLLDVRGPRLAGFLLRLAHGGQPPPDDEGGATASLLAERLAAWAAERAAPPGAGPETVWSAGDWSGGRGGGEGILNLLTPREREVALAVMDGLTNAEIAARLGIRLDTVKKHLHRVFTKLGVGSRTQLIRRLISAGL